MKVFLVILTVVGFAAADPPFDLIAEADEWAGNPSERYNFLPGVGLNLGERVGFTFELKGNDSIDITHFGVYAADEETCEFLGVEVWDVTNSFQVYSGNLRVSDADFISISSADPVLRIWNSGNTYAVVVTPLLSEGNGEGCGNHMLYSVDRPANSNLGANNGADYDPNDPNVDILEAGRYLPPCSGPSVWAPADAPYANFFVLFGYSVVTF